MGILKSRYMETNLQETSQYLGVFLKGLDLSGNGGLLSNNDGEFLSVALQPKCMCHGMHTVHATPHSLSESG